MFLQIILIVLICECVNSNGYPVFIRTRIKTNQNNGQQDDSNFHDYLHHLGVKNIEEGDGFSKDNEVKLARAHDGINFSDEMGEEKQHHDEGNLYGENYKKNNAESVSNSGNQLAHKKGHHKTGFHNTYHKDESGSNSNYYDDDHDQVSEYASDSNKANSGDALKQNQYKHNLDDRHFDKGTSKAGFYDNLRDSQNDSGNERYNNGRRYMDDKEMFEEIQSGDRYDRGGRFSEDTALGVGRPEHSIGVPLHVPESHHYYRRPYYNSDFRSPLRKTITIYEDPRVYQDSNSFADKFDEHGYRYDGGPRLDVRQPFQRDYGDYHHFRHYNDERPYDNYH